jgi:hypothetical protein
LCVADHRDLIGEKLRKDSSSRKIGALFFNLEVLANINEELLKVRNPLQYLLRVIRKKHQSYMKWIAKTFKSFGATFTIKLNIEIGGIGMWDRGIFL